MKKLVFLFSILLLSLSLCFSQEALKSVEDEYYDYLSLEGITETPTLGYKTLSDSEWKISEDKADVDHVWSKLNLGSWFTLFQPANVKENWFLNGIDQNIKLKVYGPEWFNSVNTSTPYGYNDGALWQGKGYNTSFSAGVRVEGYGFELTLKPQVSFSQNMKFDYKKPEIAGLSEYNYFAQTGGMIDLVQRYGDSHFWNFDWGDSEVRYTLYNFTIGFGTQNPWLGPAWLNPMLGSNNAGAYPKIDIGLRKTSLYIPFTNIYLGDFEARAFIGRLQESKYFDDNSDNNYRMLHGLSMSYAPSFIPGFTIGANRIFITRWKKDKLKYFLRLFTLSHDNDVAGDGEDQKVSIFVSWKFPKIGFEVYGEYGFDDFTSDKKANPFHTGIYTVGAKQVIPLPWDNVKSQLFLELNNFEMSQDFQMQWQYIGYYGHWGPWTRQGYTNNGQILGAGTGSFGNSQFVGYKVYYPIGDSMIYFHRYCPNNNHIYNSAVYDVANGEASEMFKKNYAANETYFVYGISTDIFPINSLSISGNFSIVQIHNRMYDKNADDIFNFHFELGAKYRF